MLADLARIPFKPLVVICGTTGTGKSKLAVDLALRFAQGGLSRDWACGKIINADAMQVYKGLDVLTNKLPLEEQHGIEHLLLDFKEPGEQYMVGEWVHDATQLIEDMHSRNEVPIVVGGTSYWLQHLIFSNRLATEPCDAVAPSSAPVVPDLELTKSLELLSPEMRRLFDALPESAVAADDPDLAFKLHSLLSSLDPVVAETWHWRDTRKVHRSISIMKQTGRRPSSIYQEQSQDAPRPRYRTLCLWLYAGMEVLNSRLRSRVDDMIRMGLLQEVEQLKRAASEGEALKSSGFREFSGYFDEQTPSQARMDEALERMKISTRQYAKRQVSWIRNKLIPAIYAARTGVAKDGPHAYLLDATDLSAWKVNVSSQAVRIVQDFMNEEPLPDPLSLSDTAFNMLKVTHRPIEYTLSPRAQTIVSHETCSPVEMLTARRRIICPICTVNPLKPVSLLEGSEWDTHQKTKAHHKLACATRKREAVMSSNGHKY
ncbi:tRNA isopentenyltransferase [Vararia minispora EC-137]|uniref:tRNA isopentenyltransferase n=1 Tax=Vararia minispora EC-137 TaxID=1314806 RepID=A0ACB8QDD9_9AGAM|nr:tRNA isopentenyltransferase [Vararia minispora EC-137]